MTRLDRTASLPEEMQGRWVEVDNGTILIVDGGEITCLGKSSNMTTRKSAKSMAR
jgi:hypothetical protein